MAEKDPRTYIRIHDGMPDHPKVDGLSDGAFRLLVSTWCWCSRHLTDGRVPGPVWLKRGTLKTRGELVSAGLADLTDDGAVQMHDYTDHQRTAEEVSRIREARREAGRKGGYAKANGLASATANARQTGSKSVPETETETETEVKAFAPKRATQIPANWKPNESHLEIAKEYGLDPAFQLRAFRDHHEAKGTTYKNWDAAFRTWLNKAKSFQSPAYSAPAPVARRHLPTEVPAHIDPDDTEAYAAWARGAAQ